jgi:hypothetical protein
MDRMENHFPAVTSQDQNTAVGAHFSSNNGHSGLDDLHIHVLEYVKIPPTDELQPQREQVEKKWIRRLRIFFFAGTKYTGLIPEIVTRFCPVLLSSLQACVTKTLRGNFLIFKQRKKFNKKRKFLPDTTTYK